MADRIHKKDKSTRATRGFSGPFSAQPPHNLNTTSLRCSIHRFERGNGLWYGNRMPLGRPSEYDPSYCDLARDFMSKGYSISALAGEIGVNRDSLYEWEKVHPDFSDALKQSRYMRIRALENKLLSAEIGPHVTAAIFALKNAMPDEWRDRHEVSGPDGGPIAVTVARFTETEPKE